jgi:hypothetical protein
VDLYLLSAIRQPYLLPFLLDHYSRITVRKFIHHNLGNFRGDLWMHQTLNLAEMALLVGAVGMSFILCAMTSAQKVSVQNDPLTSTSG